MAGFVRTASEHEVKTMTDRMNDSIEQSGKVSPDFIYDYGRGTLTMTMINKFLKKRVDNGKLSKIKDTLGNDFYIKGGSIMEKHVIQASEEDLHHMNNWLERILGCGDGKYSFDKPNVEMLSTFLPTKQFKAHTRNLVRDGILKEEIDTFDQVWYSRVK
jgi:hypothetical protein